MFEKYLQYLRSIDSDIRREAILALGKSGDPRALSALAYVYQTDPDPALRELAAKVGRYIHKNAPQKPGAGATPTAEPEPAPGSLWPDWAVPGKKPPPTDAPPSERWQPAWQEGKQGAKPPEPGDSESYVTPDLATVADGMWPEWATPEGKSKTLAPAPPPPDNWQPSWQAALESQEEPSGELPDDPEALGEQEPARFVSAQRRKKGRAQLNQAFMYMTVGDTERALAELAKAITTDPALGANQSARALAADLMGMTPRKALVAILKKIEAGEFKTKPAQIPLMAQSNRRFLVLALEMPLLFVGLLLFIIAYSFRIKNSLTMPDMDFILPSLLSSINGGLLERAAPITLASLVSVLFFVGIVYVVGIFAGGTGPFFRFATTMTGVQIMVCTIMGIGMLVVPFVIAVPTGQPGQYLAQLNLGWAFIGGLWVLIAESYFAGRAHNFDLYKGGMIIIVGAAVTAILGGILGLFRGSIFG